ncbi:MAG: hypothetical protein A2086_03170 [Spirochaetes bacterium GWD1_27_9]|nr:MAG: hypothetical protein A2Y34_09520 [Spirochaetes bacterium GWC1_27_15]OHD38698.1 MAG: hypothetical protein A2086_03170 [Spirochaetes bacterium GWD1_27_9]
MKKILIFVLLLNLFFIYAQDVDQIEVENNNIEQKSERVALLIALKNYKVVRGSEFVYNDAENLKEVLEKDGNFTVQYLSDKKNPVTKDDILQSLEAIRDSSSTIKTFLFYFAGYGFGLDDSNYIASCDLNLKTPKESSISTDELFSYANEISANSKTIMFLDFCRMELSNLARGTMLQNPEAEEENKGVSIIYSTSDKTPSYDFIAKKHGAFSYFLINGLKKEADVFGDNDGNITLSEIYDYLGKKVYEWSIEQKTNKEQRPVFYISTGENIVITKIKKNEESKKDKFSFNMYDPNYPDDSTLVFQIDEISSIRYKLVMDKSIVTNNPINLTTCYYYPNGKLIEKIKKKYKIKDFNKKKFSIIYEYDLSKITKLTKGKYKVEIYLEDEFLLEQKFSLK